ncbi:AAA family ATPase [Cutibacterium equinum]|uniref:AAA family ATPase n=1 Tax=Cutibacterium equinum TaxID=3016342 RepID=A0ABY7QZH0_9ACTN|nr:AAA family ATPase [Cutibacterium equinum]WCC79917.1 AAA family ATPase [Cutibacterium equinum]
MKLHRIHVENFKAIGNRTLELPDTGIVVATGPNEIGKTSMIEALDLVLGTKYKASSRAQEVRAAQRFGTSLPVVVEAEMTIGEHRCTHRKRFLKNTESSLTFISGPRAGQVVTGDEAVETMETLLAGVDMTLWNALRLMQASSLSPLRLDSSQALTAALEQTGGQKPDEGSIGGLMDRVRAEYEVYYQPATGKERKAAFEERRQLEAVSRDLEEASARLKEVDDVVEALTRINEQISHDRDVEASTKAQYQQTTAALDSLTELEKEVETTSRIAKEAGQRHTEAKSAHDVRAQLVERLTEARERHERCAQVAAEKDEKDAAVDAELAEAQSALDEATSKVAEAETAEEDARRTLSAVRAGEKAARARTQLDRINELKERISDGQRRLESEKVTSQLLTQLKNAVKTDDLAKEAAALASTQLIIEHRAEGDPLRIDGTELDLPVGQTLQRSIDGELVMEMGDLWRLRISPTSEVMNLARDADQAHQAVESLLGELGVSNLEQAEARMAERKVLQSHLASWQEQLEREQGESTIQELEALADHTSEDVPLTPAQAQKLEDDAVAKANDARNAERQAQARFNAVDKRRSEAHDQALRAKIDLDHAAETLDRLTKELANARKTAPDDDLAQTLKTAEEENRVAKADADRAAAALAERNPDQVHAEAQGSQLALSKATARLKEDTDRQLELKGQLLGLGRQDRQAEVDALSSKHHQLARRVAGLEKRARSTKLLYDTLTHHLDKVRQSYVAPFTGETDRIGQAVFGPDLHVEIDSTLTVVARHLKGTRMEWDQLSSGAREQLGLVVRLAAAHLIDPDDGVPVILDDALVYSDAVRVRHILTEVARGAQTSQIVVFTSAPERYDSVPGAQQVRFD